MVKKTLKNKSPVKIGERKDTSLSISFSFAKIGERFEVDYLSSEEALAIFSRSLAAAVVAGTNSRSSTFP